MRSSSWPFYCIYSGVSSNLIFATSISGVEIVWLMPECISFCELSNDNLRNDLTCSLRNARVCSVSRKVALFSSRMVSWDSSFVESETSDEHYKIEKKLQKKEKNRIEKVYKNRGKNMKKRCDAILGMSTCTVQYGLFIRIELRFFILYGEWVRWGSGISDTSQKTLTRVWADGWVNRWED